MSFADSAKGLCPLDSRNFFEKKLSKSFISPAGGMGFQICFYAVVAVLPKAGQDGRDHAPQGGVHISQTEGDSYGTSYNFGSG